MRKKNLVCALVSLAVMIFLPWCAVTFGKGDGGMALCFILFFAVDPILSLWVGAFAGKNVEAFWFQPSLCALWFLLGTWLLFDMGEPAFALYAGIYLLLGNLAMAISWLASRGKKSKKAA